MGSKSVFSQSSILLVFSCLVISVLADTDLTKAKIKHQYRNLTNQRIMKVVDKHNMDLFKQILRHILVERIPDTPGIREVRQFIVNDLRSLGWDIQLDDFFDETPIGRKNFVNIIATQNRNARRWLTLACHYDSKILKGEVFLAATDSAVPCTMMLHLAHQLNDKLTAATDGDVSLQLVFLDGEEAFERWTANDSIYGARHLTNVWSEIPYPPANTDGTTQLDRIDMFILLDLIGTPNPRFHNWFPSTSRHFQRLADTEQQLIKLQRTLEQKRDDTVLLKPYSTYYFSRSLYHGDPYIEDDHIPFMRRNVPILHMINVPFPKAWHTAGDNESILDYDTIQNLNAILRVFVTEYLHLPV